MPPAFLLDRFEASILLSADRSVDHKGIQPPVALSAVCFLISPVSRCSGFRQVEVKPATLISPLVPLLNPFKFV
jgi:hypothetical protein